MGVADAVDRICVPASERSATYVVVTPNIAHIAMLEDDRSLRAAYARADLVLPDGWPVAWAVSRLGGEPVSRVTGADLLPAVLERCADRGLSVALVGGREGAARRLAKQARDQYPALRVVLADGSYFPGIDPRVDARQLAELLPGEVDIVVLGLGAPKQEALVGAGVDGDVLPVSTYLCFGAAIDFASGVVPRAPDQWQRVNMEWAFRLVHEPRRLVRRYAIAAPRFASVVLGEWRRERRGHAEFT